jgi:DNA modification methylase
MRTLNSEQKRKNLIMHICPLQFDIVERLINRFTNKDEIVLDMFGGIMTVPHAAIRLGRYGIGIELNSEYYKDGLNYLKKADYERSMAKVSLFEEVA